MPDLRPSEQAQTGGQRTERKEEEQEAWMRNEGEWWRKIKKMSRKRHDANKRRRGCNGEEGVREGEAGEKKRRVAEDLGAGGKGRGGRKQKDSDAEGKERRRGGRIRRRREEIDPLARSYAANTHATGLFHPDAMLNEVLPAGCSSCCKSLRLRSPSHPFATLCEIDNVRCTVNDPDIREVTRYVCRSEFHPLFPRQMWNSSKSECRGLSSLCLGGPPTDAGNEMCLSFE